VPNANYFVVYALFSAVTRDSTQFHPLAGCRWDKRSPGAFPGGGGLDEQERTLTGSLLVLNPKGNWRPHGVMSKINIDATLSA